MGQHLLVIGCIFGGALIYALGLLAAAHAALTVRTSQGAVAWAVSLVFIPYCALIPYMIFGRSKFAGHVDARRSNNRKFRQITAHIGQSGSRMEPAPPVGHRLPGIETLVRLTGLPFTSGNDVRLLINGEMTFNAILEAIAAARQYVLVQFFVVHDDGLGRRLKAALLAKAATNVPVYFLYDAVGSHDLPQRYVNDLRTGGIQVLEFLTRNTLINRYQLNFRNHRKIVIVDGQRAYVGGHNVGDEYLGLKPPLSPWRDTHIEITGPGVASIQLAFVEDWYWVSHEIPTLQWEPSVSSQDMHCQVVPSGPADEQETCALFFVQAINSARTRLWITTPYLIPDEAVFAALKLAVLRGVDVRLLIPSRPDHRIVFVASSLYAYEAVCCGIKVYRYGPGFLHQKVILIDQDAAAVGSANLDNRSFRLNFEITVLTLDRDFAKAVEAMLAQDFARSTPIDRSEYEQQASVLKRLEMRIARLFAPIL